MKMDFFQSFYRLYRQIGALEMQKIRQSHHTDLSSSELMILHAIAENGQPTMSELAADIHVTQGTLTVAVNRLVKKGYVERHRMQEDRRIIRTKLTRLGQTALSVDKTFREELAGWQQEALGEEEALHMSHMLEQFTAYLEKFINIKEEPKNDF